MIYFVLVTNVHLYTVGPLLVDHPTCIYPLYIKDTDPDTD